MNCFHCGKGVMYGRSHTHHRGVAGGRWKKRAPKTQRLFQPNLQPVMIVEHGVYSRIKLCNKCLKRIKKDMVDGKKPFLKLANVPANIVAAMKVAEASRNTVVDSAPVVATA